MSSKPQNRRKSDVAFSSVIAEGTEIQGAYTGKTDLLVAGILHGDVDINGTVFVAETAVVHGSVLATVAVVVGRVTGDVRAKKAAEIRHKAVIGGAVRSKEIYIAVGAKIGGEVIASSKDGPREFEERRG
jgi:cytoskeletal protein CcmA (bactofilin family)